MTQKTYIKTVSVAASILMLSAGNFAFANDGEASLGASANLGVKVGKTAELHAEVKAKVDEKRLANIHTRADQEVDRRTEGLTKLVARINEMKHISADQKASLSASVQAQISALATLKAKVDADTALDLLKTDAQSITKSYRIFALIMPQIEITAAADRAADLASQFDSLKAKLDARIAAAKAAGKDTTAIATLRADIDTKLADSKVQSDAAISLVASLKPDNGDKATMAANGKALRDARGKVQAANKDLKAAREDANKIARMLREMDLKASANASTTVNTQ